MTERITTDDVAKVAKLARLRLTPDELTRFTGQLSDVLDHAADLQSLNLDGVEPMAQPIPLSNVFRADEVGIPLDRAEVLGSAPVAENGQYRVPPVLGESE
ncbi:MAG TPA: Asp-tRNA(Asn)/Glu-tRNA(Gln) amidotransferase subunit GatC [Microthrixaceae bacterium]|nr:Asp-tRNA(Asn)/Glu-tRNA(Gln) amidotransferase subunit GatC [Microthrixaceae bacterium]